MLRQTMGAMAVLGGLASVFFAGCGGGAVEAPVGVTAEELEDGATSTLSGLVSGRIDDRAFAMKGENMERMPDIAVVSRTALPENVADGARVEVSGTVRKVSGAEIEEEINWNFDEEVVKSFETIDAFLVADSVKVVDETR